MFWRADPRPNASTNKKGGDDWPRNGALLKGVAHDVGGTKYLCVDSWKQNGSDTWITDCEGLWMLFAQGGPVLHKV